MPVRLLYTRRHATANWLASSRTLYRYKIHQPASKQRQNNSKLLTDVCLWDMWDVRGTVMMRSHTQQQQAKSSRPVCVCICMWGAGLISPLQRHSTGFVLLYCPSWYRVQTDPSQTSLSSSYRWLVLGRARRSSWALSSGEFPALVGECVEVLS